MAIYDGIFLLMAIDAYFCVTFRLLGPVNMFYGRRVECALAVKIRLK